MKNRCFLPFYVSFMFLFLFFFGVSIKPQAFEYPFQCADGISWGYNDFLKKKIDTKNFPSPYYAKSQCLSIALLAADQFYKQESNINFACKLYSIVSSFPCTVARENSIDRADCKRAKKKANEKIILMKKKFYSQCQTREIVPIAFEKKNILWIPEFDFIWSYKQKKYYSIVEVSKNLLRLSIGKDNWYIERNVHLVGRSLDWYASIWKNRMRAYPNFPNSQWKKQKDFFETKYKGRIYKVWLVLGKGGHTGVVSVVSINAAQNIEFIKGKALAQVAQ